MCSTTSHTSKDHKLVYYHVNNSVPKSWWRCSAMRVTSSASLAATDYGGVPALAASALAASSTFGLYTSKHSLSNSNSVWSLSASLSPKSMSFHICWSHTTAVSSKTNYGILICKQCYFSFKRNQNLALIMFNRICANNMRSDFTACMIKVKCLNTANYLER